MQGEFAFNEVAFAGVNPGDLGRCTNDDYDDDDDDDNYDDDDDNDDDEDDDDDIVSLIRLLWHETLVSAIGERLLLRFTRHDHDHECDELSCHEGDLKIKIH